MKQQQSIGSTRLASRMGGVRSSAIRDLLEHAQRPDMISFAGGLPDPTMFDRHGIDAATSAALQDRASLQYGSTAGQQVLREALAAGMRDAGMAVAHESLLVTTGSQQALDLVARMLLDPGDTVLVERPTYLAALQVFALAQAQVLGVPVDRDGMCVEQLDTICAQAARQGLRKPRLLYIVPDFGNPSGVCLSQSRRRALLRWALENEVFVLEDAPYAALHFDVPAGPSLLSHAQQIDGAAPWLIYQSSLSKTVAPALRVGWLSLPQALYDSAVMIKQGLDLHSSTLTQMIAAHYLASGRLPAHMEIVRTHYRARCECLLDALVRAFGQRLEVNRPAGGMFVWARFRDGTDARALLLGALAQGVMFVPGADFFADAPDASSLRLAFATVEPLRIDAGVERLCRAHQAIQHLSP